MPPDSSLALVTTNKNPPKQSGSLQDISFTSFEAIMNYPNSAGQYGQVTPPNGKHLNGNRPNGNHPNGTYPNGTHSDGNRSNGNHPNGTYVNGDHPNGKHPNGNYEYANHPYDHHHNSKHLYDNHLHLQPNELQYFPEAPLGQLVPLSSSPFQPSPIQFQPTASNLLEGMTQQTTYGNPSLSIDSYSQFSGNNLYQGDAQNVSSATTFNHSGPHINAINAINVSVPFRNDRPDPLLWGAEDYSVPPPAASNALQVDSLCLQRKLDAAFHHISSMKEEIVRVQDFWVKKCDAQRKELHAILNLQGEELAAACAESKFWEDKAKNLLILAEKSAQVPAAVKSLFQEVGGLSPNQGNKSPPRNLETLGGLNPNKRENSPAGYLETFALGAASPSLGPARADAVTIDLTDGDDSSPTSDSSASANPVLAQAQSLVLDRVEAYTNSLKRKPLAWMGNAHPLRSPKKPRPYGPGQKGEKEDSTVPFGSLMSTANGTISIIQAQFGSKAPGRRQKPKTSPKTSPKTPPKTSPKTPPKTPRAANKKQPRVASADAMKEPALEQVREDKVAPAGDTAAVEKAEEAAERARTPAEMEADAEGNTQAADGCPPMTQEESDEFAAELEAQLEADYDTQAGDIAGPRTNESCNVLAAELKAKRDAEHDTHPGVQQGVNSHAIFLSSDPFAALAEEMIKPDLNFEYKAPGESENYWEMGSLFGEELDVTAEGLEAEG